MRKDRRRLLPPHLDLHLEVFVPKKKEIAAAGGWGVTEYLQLDWMDDRTDGWMEKASRPRRPLLYVIAQVINVKPYVNSLKVHAQLSHKRLPVHGDWWWMFASLCPITGMRTLGPIRLQVILL